MQFLTTCIHDLDPALCGQCSPGRPASRRAPGGLVIRTNLDGSDIMLHTADCHHAQDPTDGRNPWPRREVTKAEADAARWRRCKTCAP